MTEVPSKQENHLLTDRQLDLARLELQGVTDCLWDVVGYNQDPIKAATEAFPESARRRSDTNFTATPEEEVSLRKKAAALGPGRRGAETLKDLGVEKVDAEVIEPGQLHKTATELWLALHSEQKSPLIVFASDRTIPMWVKGQENNTFDAERLSTARLMAIGGLGLAGVQFFYRAGGFDAQSEDNHELIRAQALELPDNEYEVTENFLRSALDEALEEELPIGFDPEDGRLIASNTGQVRRLGKVNGRDVVLVHKEKREDGTALDTTSTILLMGRIAAAQMATSETTIGYYTSATYKPSRLMSGIRAGILAAQSGSQLKVVVPTYGYEDLSTVQGKSPAPPTIQNIASEISKAAQEASELREFLTNLQS